MKKILAPLVIASALTGNEGIQLASLNLNFGNKYKVEKKEDNQKLDKSEEKQLVTEIENNLENFKDLNLIILDKTDFNNKKIKIIRGHKIYTNTGASINDAIAESLLEVAIVLDKYIPENLSFKGNHSNQGTNTSSKNKKVSMASIFYNIKF